MGDWSEYVADFHAGRAGVTERVLHRARGDTGDPYDWLAAAVPPDGVVLDVGCGSAPLWPRLPRRAYVGVDLSAAELVVARRHGADRLVRASAAALPLASGSVDVVVCSMALQVLTPLPAVLAEFSRVLKSGGRLVATMPDRGPLRVADVPVLAGLLAALGRGLGYPNDNLLARLPALLSAVGCGWSPTSGSASTTGWPTPGTPTCSWPRCTCRTCAPTGIGRRKPCCGRWPGSGPTCRCRSVGWWPADGDALPRSAPACSSAPAV